MTAPIENFGRNVMIRPASTYEVDTEAEVLSILAANPGKRFRAIGSLHAWSDAAQTDEVLITMRGLNSVQIAQDKKSAWVGAGCKVKRLLQKLSNRGLTLPAVGLIDEQTIAGATATGTHGSGSNCLSHFIQAVRIAHFDNEGKVTLSTIDAGDDLRAARCSLGLMGIIVAIKIQCRKKYNIQEHAQAHRSLEDVIAMETTHPQQQFYLMPWSWTYFGHHRVETDQPRSRWATLYRLYCFLVIDVGLHIGVTFLSRMLKSAAAIRFFYQRILPWTIIKRWKVVDDSHAMLVMEHELFRHIEIELFVPRSKVQATNDVLIDIVSVFGGRPMRDAAKSDALLDSAGKKEELDSMAGSYCHHYPICFRRIKPDHAMLTASSPSDIAGLDEDWYAISFISYHCPADRDGFYKFANFIGPVIAELFGGRCHWGKYNPLSAEENDCLYRELESFRDVVKRFDLERRFANKWLDTVV